MRPARPFRVRLSRLLLLPPLASGGGGGGACEVPMPDEEEGSSEATPFGDLPLELDREDGAACRCIGSSSLNAAYSSLPPVWAFFLEEGFAFPPVILALAAAAAARACCAPSVAAVPSERGERVLSMMDEESITPPPVKEASRRALS